MSAACPDCGTAAPPGARFCPQCGTGLPVVGSTGLPPEGEMRHVSVVFCDLVDSTGLTDVLDAEDVRTVLSGYYAVAREVIGRHGGVVV
jgi:class 3 adenylate cyclase